MRTEALTERCLAYAEGCAMLPPPGGRLLCAVSGGADSVCLLLLMQWAAEKRGFDLVCAHYDHGLRGAESQRDADFVRTLCQRLGIPFSLEKGDVAAEAKRRGKGIEETARALRYAFLERTASEWGAERIATAHNGEDNAETMLLNLARGAGSAGLAGIPPVRGKLIRPLLFARRREIEAFLAERGEGFVTDSSNFSKAYARNRVRLEAMPALGSVNEAFVPHALAAAERLRQDEACLTALAAAFVRENLRPEPEGDSLLIGAFAALPSALRYRVLRQLCPQGPEACHIQAAEGLLAPDGGGQAELPGIVLRRSFDRLYFLRVEPPGPMPERYLEIPGELEIPEAGLRLRASWEIFGEINNSFNIFFFQMTKPCGRIAIRPRKAGDRIHLPGRGCGKSLKKLFAEAKIPEWRRERIPVLSDEKGILGIPGFGPEESRLASPGEEALKIEIIREK